MKETFRDLKLIHLYIIIMIKINRFNTGNIWDVSTKQFLLTVG